MRPASLGLSLALISVGTIGRADQLFGYCWEAWPATPGVSGGYSAYDEYHDGLQEYWTHSKWHTLSVPPGQTFVIRAQPTSGYDVMQVFANLYDSCPTTGLMVGTALPPGMSGGFPNAGVSITNTTASPKPYWLQVFMWAHGDYGYMTYSLDVQATITIPFVSYCPGAVNSTGAAAVLSGTGSPSISANTMTFSATQLPATTMGLLASGLAQTQSAFGDGALCIAGSVARLRVAPGTSGGTWSAPMDFPTLPPGVISPGSVRYVQLYYRDSAGPLGTGFNLTNGVAVSFAP